MNQSVGAEKQVLFSEAMILAYLRNNKTQTRRSLLPSTTGRASPWSSTMVGDLLWTREPLLILEEGIRYSADELLIWSSSGPMQGGLDAEFWDQRHAWWLEKRTSRAQRGPLLEPFYQPRWASRLTLPVIDAEDVELTSISPEDVKAEGLTSLSKDDGRLYKWGIPDRDGLPGSDDFGWEWHYWDADPIAAYRRLWRDLHGIDSWKEGTPVRKITFPAFQKIAA